MTHKRLASCPQCNSPLLEDWNFCKCGTALRDLRRVCNHCHRVVKNDAESCVHCGRGLEEIESKYVLIRWERRPEEFARRIVVGDLRGALDGGVVVEHGTKALFLVDGAVQKELSAGWQGTVSDPLSAFAGEEYVHRVEVIAVDAGDTHLRWNLPATTSDSFQVTAFLDLTVSIANVAHLATTLLKENLSLKHVDLQTWLEPEVASILQARVAESGSEELRAVAAEYLQSLEQELRDRLDRALSSAGLRLERVRRFAAESPRLKELLGDRETAITNARKAALAEERLGPIEKLQDVLLRKQCLDEDMRLKLEQSKILTDAEIFELDSEIKRRQSDQHYGWALARDVLQAKHDVEIEKISKENELQLFVARQEADLGLLRQRRELDAEMIERDREHKARTGREMMEARHRAAREWAEKVRGMSAEEILAVGAAIYPDSAEVLKSKYEGASAEEQLQLRKEMEGKLLLISQEAQERAFRLAERAIGSQASSREEEIERLSATQREAMRSMSGAAGAARGGVRRVCEKCGAERRPGDRFCSACGEPLPAD